MQHGLPSPLIIKQNVPPSTEEREGRTMGEPIIIWPPDGGNLYGDPCTVYGQEYGIPLLDCSDEYYYLLQPGEYACCPAE